jgi:zinc protease
MIESGFFYGADRSRRTILGTELDSLPGPEDIHRVELSNGIIVLARSNFNSPSVVVQGYLHAGSLSDPDDRLGLAAFTGSCLMRGTEKRDFQGIYDAIESVGANLGFDGGTHTSSFGGRSLAEDLDLLLELISDNLRQPAFPPEQVEKLRAQYLTGLAIRAQDTGEMASITFDEIVYKGHPYSRLEDGAPETIRAISRDDLVNFHRRHYGPQGMVVVVVGGVEPAEAVGKVAAVLGDWHNPDYIAPPDLPPHQPLAGLERRQVIIPGKSQADLVVGAAGPQRRSPGFLAASLGNNVLGQFGMYGRIGDVIREQAGLAYSAYSSLSGGIGPGPWYISAGVDPLKVERVIDLIVNEIKKFVSEGVTEEELNDSKANYIGRLPLSMETNFGVAAALVNLERYQLGLDYYHRYPALISAVAKEEIRQAALRYLNPERLAIAAAGSLNEVSGDPE